MLKKELRKMHAEKAIEDVVKTVKSEGLFDQFRKECIDEFEKMDTYRNLKLQVEIHVETFLLKHQVQEGLLKNQLRSNLRQNISISNDLITSVQHLVDEVLSIKGHSFCLRIDKEVDRYLNTSKKEETKDVDKKNGISDEAIRKNKTHDKYLESSNSTKSKKIVEEIETDRIEVEQIEMEISGKPLYTEIKEMSPNLESQNSECTPESDHDEIEKFIVIEKKGALSLTKKDIIKKDENMIARRLAVKPKARESDIEIYEDIDDIKSMKELGYANESENDVSKGSDDEKKSEKQNYQGLITEPITSNESASNDDSSSFNDEPKQCKTAIDDNYCTRRKSGRIRTVPAKFREIQENTERRGTNTDDTDSISSIETEKDEENQRIGESIDSQKTFNEKRHLNSSGGDKRTLFATSMECSKTITNNSRKRFRDTSNKKLSYTMKNLSGTNDKRSSKYENLGSKRTRKRKQIYSPS